ncbi:MAG: hypothetical protein LBO08_01115 [Rickettsiales bacterium]|jgi:hypothetical protein|nr:hypothetical protein [Rickettsiales bacterium]
MLIGFTPNTNMILLRLVLRRWRHCAVVYRGYMYHIGPDGNKKIRLNKTGIRLLENAGWVFVRMRAPANAKKILDREVNKKYSLLPLCGTTNCFRAAKAVVSEPPPRPYEA